MTRTKNNHQTAANPDKKSIHIKTKEQKKPLQ